MELNKIIQGDVLTVLKTIPDESIDLVMTSPPYFGLRNYGENLESIWGGDEKCEHKWNTHERWLHRGSTKMKEWSDERGKLNNQKAITNFCELCGAWKGQLGLEPTFEMYLDNMLAITGQLKRVLKKGGNVFWNHGDSYNGTGGNRKIETERETYKKYNPKLRAGNGVNLDTMAKKCLIGQPWRLAIAMVDRQGWILRSDIKWIKQILLWGEKRTIGSVMPTSVDDRFNISGEYLFHFVKSSKYYFNLDAIKIKTAESNEERPRMGQRTPGGELVHPNKFNIRTRGGKPVAFMASPQEFDKEWNEKKQEMYGDDDAGARRSRVRAFLNTKGKQAKYTTENPNAQPDGRAHFQTGKALHDYYKDKGIEESWEYKKNIPNAWLIGTEPSKEEHYAQYPTALCEIPIMTACPKDGVVLDPFMGSGTTGIVAKLLGRKYVGIEISPKNVKIAEARLRATPEPML
jgi:site-specific DNA-methyltransferase (cytosine-N4-specific)